MNSISTYENREYKFKSFFHEMLLIYNNVLLFYAKDPGRCGIVEI